jgi:hypothetical protein
MRVMATATTGTDPPALHPDVAVLAPLLGTWRGAGAGRYPTIEPFTYREEVTFGHNGKPFLAYRQATVNQATGLPAHAETGYWRAVGDGRIEVVLAHPTGLVEVTSGRVEGDGDGLRLVLTSDSIGRTATAKDVRMVERRFTLAGDVLSYELAMAAVGLPLQHHLAAELHRAAPADSGR